MATIAYPSFPILGGSDLFLQTPSKYGICQVSPTKWVISASQRTPDYTAVQIWTWDDVANTFSVGDWYVLAAKAGTSRIVALNSSTLLLTIYDNSNVDHNYYLLDLNAQDEISVLDTHFETNPSNNRPVYNDVIEIVGNDDWATVFFLNVSGNTRFLRYRSLSISGGTISFPSVLLSETSVTNTDLYTKLHHKQSQDNPNKWFVTWVYGNDFIIGEILNGTLTQFSTGSISFGSVPIIEEREPGSIVGIRDGKIYQWTSPTNQLPSFDFGTRIGNGNPIDLIAVDPNTLVSFFNQDMKVFHYDSSDLIIPSQNTVSHGLNLSIYEEHYYFPRIYKLTGTKLLAIFWNGSTFAYRVIEVPA